MKKTDASTRLGSGFCRVVFALAVLWGGSASPVSGGVRLDGSMGTKATLGGPSYSIEQSMGKLSGKNLFHSFSEFNLKSFESATFNGNAGIRNIVGRITGGAASSIDGSINVAIAGANLWLTNPSGMIFGANARLNTTGSFHASTADYLLFSDGVRFETGNAQTPAILSSVNPAAFGFTSGAPAGIVYDCGVDNRGYLMVGEGRDISLVGGDIYMRNATVYSQGGAIRVASVASPGEVAFDGSGFSMNGFSKLGSINITHPFARWYYFQGLPLGDLDASWGQGGTVYIRGGEFVLDQGAIYADNYGFSQTPGGISIITSGDAILRNFSTVRTLTVGDSRAGDINFDVGSFSLEFGSEVASITSLGGDAGDIRITSARGASLSDFSTISEVSLSGSGKGGDIILNVDSFSMSGMSEIWSRTNDTGNSGNIFLNARNGVSMLDMSTISSTAQEGSTGNAGTIALDVGSITVAGGSHFNTMTSGAGNSGNVSITSRGHAEFSGFAYTAGNPVMSGIFSATDYGSTGNAGNILLNAGSLAIKDGAQISTISMGTGNSGNINVISPGAVSVSGYFLDDAGESRRSIIISSSIEGSEGKAGDVTFNVGSLSLADGATIISSSLGRGNSGQISITARDLVSVSGYAVEESGKTYSSGIYSLALPSSPDFTSNAGDVYVTARSVELSGGGEIHSDTFGAGKGGLLRVKAEDSIIVSGESYDRGSFYPSGFYSASAGSGPGGNIELQANTIILNRGAVSAEALSTGSAGNIEIMAGTLFESNGGYVRTKAIDSLGGNIRIAGKDIRLLENSEVTARVDQGAGSGGNVTIDATTLVAMQNSDITASAWLGYGGNININAMGVFFSPDVDLNASSQVTGREGAISINSPSTNVSGNLFKIPENFLNVDTLLPRSCNSFSEEDASTFTIRGRGGAPPKPDIF